MSNRLAACSSHAVSTSKPMYNAMKNAIIYHRVDWDGYTSAAVALKAFPQAELIGWNYRDPLPIVDSYDTVIVVDLTVYSVNSDGSRDFSWMIKNQSKLIWIDHHPIISEVPGDYRGIQEQSIGACWLTWKYFHDEYGISCNTQHLKYAATFDVFRKDGWLCSWEDAWAYQLFLNKFGPSKTQEDAKRHVDYAEDLIDAYDIEIEQHLRDGYMLEQERSLKEKMYFKKHAQKVIIDEHEGWLIESTEQPAIVVKDHSDACDGDFFILFSKYKKDKDGNFIVSIRVPEASNFNAQAFARAHGGGGYLKAAGCVICEDELNEISSSEKAE